MAHRDTVDPEGAVLDRYSRGARTQEAALCCAVSYDPRYLEVLPAEIVDRDYGCGDPTVHVREGDVVLDLGSGTGKACWIAAQIAGPNGRVIGVDMNPEMLALARRHQPEIARRIGYDNVSFHRAMIQDLKLDLDVLERELGAEPVRDADGWLALRRLEDRLRREAPMIGDNSVDVVVSNCVLNLVRAEDKPLLFTEIHRVVRNGGRVAISDIVSDEDIPCHLQDDPELWSGCISGAMREDRFVQAFVDAGFHGVRIAARDEQPWRTVAGIEFRSVTIEAFKGDAGPGLERNQAVVYRGPFSRVYDEDGRAFFRGERMAVSDRTFDLLMREPYAGSFLPIEPREAVPPEAVEPFVLRGTARRHPRDTKGCCRGDDTDSGSACGSSGGC
jgi:SAM-dependent methyltransferase